MVVARQPPPTAGSRLPRGDGEHFGPSPGATLLRTGTDGGVRVVASPGAPVHAVCSGTVQVVEEGLRLVGDDAHRWTYESLEATAAAVEVHLDAGAIVGHVAAVAGSSGFGLRVTDADGSALDAWGLLLGAPDPNELGYDDVGTGADVDPARLAPHRMATRRTTTPQSARAPSRPGRPRRPADGGGPQPVAPTRTPPPAAPAVPAPAPTPSPPPGTDVAPPRTDPTSEAATPTPTDTTPILTDTTPTDTSPTPTDTSPTPSDTPTSPTDTSPSPTDTRPDVGPTPDQVEPADPDVDLEEALAAAGEPDQEAPDVAGPPPADDAPPRPVPGPVSPSSRADVSRGVAAAVVEGPGAAGGDDATDGDDGDDDEQRALERRREAARRLVARRPTRDDGGRR